MVINSGDVRYLLKLDNYDTLPEVDTDPLTVAWYGIYQGFSECVGGNRSDLWLIKQKQIITLKLKHEIDASVLNVVRELPIPQTVEIARDCGYEIDLEDFKASFERALSQLRQQETKIRIIEAEGNHEEKKEDLDGLIVALERHQGYQFNEHTMTVKKFASIYKAFKNVKNRV